MGVLFSVAFVAILFFGEPNLWSAAAVVVLLLTAWALRRYEDEVHD